MRRETPDNAERTKTMNTERFEELLSLLLERRLDDAGQRELAEVLETHPSETEEAFQLWRQDARMRYLMTARPDVARSAADILDTLRQQTPPPGTLSRKVIAHIGRGAAAGTVRSTRRLRAHASRSAGRYGSRHSVLVAWGAAAAAVLILAWALVVQSPPPTTSPPSPQTLSKGPAVVPEAGAPIVPAEGKPSRAAPKVAAVPPQAPTRARDEARPPAVAPSLEAAPPPAVPTGEAPAALAQQPLASPPAAPPPTAQGPASPTAAQPTSERITLELAQGRVFAVSALGHKTPVKSGQALSPGDGLETVGRDSQAAVVFADATRIELGKNGKVDRIVDPAATAEVRTGRGKNVAVALGSLVANVARQPDERPMIFTTPHAEVLVRGTVLTLAVAAGSTRVEVREGQVRVTRRDGAWVDLTAGQYAIAGKGIDLLVMPIDGGTPTPGVLALTEDFADPRSAAARWDPIKGGFPTVVLGGKLDVDVSPRPADKYPEGWHAAGGLFTKAGFRLPLRVTAVVEATVAHDDLIAAFTLRPAPGSSGGEIWIGLRDGVVLAGAGDGAGERVLSSPAPTRWSQGGARMTVEAYPDGDIRAFVDGREVMHQKAPAWRPPETCQVGFTGNAHQEVPKDARIRFGAVRIEQLKK